MYQQQESSSQDTYRQEQKSSYGAYEGFASGRDDATGTTYGQGQKIGTSAAQQGPLWEYRLGLIIVSLVFWMIFFFIVVFTIINISVKIAFFVDPLLLIGLIVFTALVVGANLLFNRKR